LCLRERRSAPSGDHLAGFRNRRPSKPPQKKQRASARAESEIEFLAYVR